MPPHEPGVSDWRPPAHLGPRPSRPLIAASAEPQTPVWFVRAAHEQTGPNDQMRGFASPVLRTPAWPSLVSAASGRFE